MKKQINFSGQQVFYSVSGSGPSVMLVHGFGEDHRVWDNFKTLDKKYKLIIPDLPGSGDSPFNGKLTSMTAYADCLEEIRKSENAGTISMIGHSMGGYITLAYAEKHGSQLKSFGLFHSSASSDNEEKIGNRRKGIEFMKQHGGKAFLETAIPKLFSPVTTDRQPDLVKNTIEEFSNLKADALIAYYEAMISRPDRTDVLKSSKVPVLFIIGEDDQAVLPADSIKQSHLPAVSSVHILKECGHLGMIEKPGDTLNMVSQFLDFAHNK